MPWPTTMSETTAIAKEMIKLIRSILHYCYWNSAENFSLGFDCDNIVDFDPKNLQSLQDSLTFTTVC